MSDDRYEHLNDIVMTTIYSPLLLVTAYMEARAGRQVVKNRGKHHADEDTTEEWERLGPLQTEGDGQPLENGGGAEADQRGLIDFEGDGWAKLVENSKPNVETDAAILELRYLQKQVKELTDLVIGLKSERS